MSRYVSRFSASFATIATSAIVVGCAQPPKLSPGFLVDAACGECQFELPGAGCDLAVRIDGVAYFVDGTRIDDHGDAHAADGFCNAVRQARVTGQVEDGRFTATSFELLPDVGE